MPQPPGPEKRGDASVSGASANGSEWERQQAQIPPAYYPEPPVAVVPSLPEPSSPADPALNPEPMPAPAQPTPTRRATQKPASTVAQAASRPVKPPAPETAPLPGAAPPPVVDPNPTVTAIGDSRRPRRSRSRFRRNLRRRPVPTIRSLRFRRPADPSSRLSAAGGRSLCSDSEWRRRAEAGRSSNAARASPGPARPCR